MGNICQINENGKLLAKYTYDGLNRLIREDNAKLGKTYLFDYDGTGNITSKRECAFTLDKAESITAFSQEETYMYDGDKLIRTGSSGKSSYNANGKLTSYLGLLISFKEGGLISSYRSFAYEYDALCRRTKKGSITYTYDKNGLLSTQSDGISFIYDHNDQMVGIKNGTTPYYFRKNLQGDIVALLDSYGFVVVRYYYDAWGNHKIYNASGAEVTDTTHIGHLNPIRYRGYYFDKELGLYYLKSRYYDPIVGRFISQDDVEYADYESIGGLNLYAYCNNDPVNRFDPTGHSWGSFWNGVGDWFSDHWKEVVVGTAFIIGGAIVTALTCGAGTTAWAAFGSALLSSAIQVGAGIGTGVLLNGVSNLIQGNDFFDNVGDTIASAYMLGGILSGGSQMLSGGFRFLRAKTGFKGIDSKNFGFMSADKLYYDKPGMTVLRLGSRNGAKLAIDFGRYGIHGHIWKWSTHIPLIPGIVGVSELF